MIKLLYKIVYFFYIRYYNVFKRFLKLFVIFFCFWTLYTMVRSTMINEITDYAKVIQTVTVIANQDIPEDLEDEYKHLINMIKDVDTPIYNTYSYIKNLFIVNEKDNKIDYETGYIGFKYKQEYFMTGFKYSFLIHCIVYGFIFIIGYLFTEINEEDDDDSISIIVGILCSFFVFLLLFLVSVIISIVFPFYIFSWELTQIIVIVCNLIIDIFIEVLIIKISFGTKMYEETKEELLSGSRKENE